MAAEQLLTVDQAALRLHLRPATIRRQLRDGILRGVKRGHVWRVPESALVENGPAPVRTMSSEEQAEALWQDIISGQDDRRSAAMRVLAFTKDEKLREILVERSGEAAAKFYASPEGQEEWEDLADWRALDGEPFHGFEDDEDGS